jgi:signal transduction histidine kinase
LELRPPLLDDVGLVPAIEWQLSEFRKRTGIHTRLTGVWDVEITTDHAITIYRLIQEALTNIIRHAKASRVEVGLEIVSGNLLVHVTDNGRGISSKEANSPTSLGLIGMSERVNRVGGRLKIGRRPGGKGTRLDFLLPLSPPIFEGDFQ